jgi:hypothetical protein
VDQEIEFALEEFLEDDVLKKDIAKLQEKKKKLLNQANFKI